jgi:hypothetical protein
MSYSSFFVAKVFIPKGRYSGQNAIILVRTKIPEIIHPRDFLK